MPEPGLILAMKVRDERWFEWAERVLAGNAQTINGDDAGAGLRLRTVPVPLPLPMEVRVSVARAGDYLWVTTHDQLMRQVVQIKSGKAPGLRTVAEFRKLTDGLPTEGNQFGFASERVGDLVRVIQRTALAASGQQGSGPPAALMQKLMAMGGKVAGASVGSVGPEGWLTVSHGHQEPSASVLLSAVVAPTAVLAGMTLPALAKAKGKAQSISCVNNLKQLGLAARIYASDHGDTFPPDVLAMKNELVTPRILICPLDPAAAQAQSLTWESLRPEAVSYDYLAAGQKDGGADPQTPCFRCRFHSHICRMDGSVQASAEGAR